MRIPVLIACSAALIAAGAGFAQTTDANLLGIVVDASGGGIPNANVEVTNQATQVRTSTKTEATGQYRFNNLPIGTYDVNASAAGFTSATLKNVHLVLNQNATANLTLQVGTVSSTVDVSEAAATIDTTTAQLQSTFESRQIVNLPIIENANGLFGALNLSLLAAGVASNGGVGYGTGPSVGGQRPVENNFQVEGVDNNNKGVTGPLVYVPTEATAEFTLLQNQTNAEFGHSTGGQFNTVIKSGTNEIHGSLYEYFQNRNLNAVDQAFARQGFLTNPRYDQNKMGFAIGGPIVKDKIFYFGSIEYAPFGFASTTGSPVFAPTAAGYSTLGNLAGVSKTNLSIMQKYVPAAPVANGDPVTVNGASIPTGIVPIAGANFTNFWSAIGSVDVHHSDTDQIRARFIYNKSNSLDNAANLPVFWTTLPQRFYLATVSNIHNFTPTVTNELRLGFNRFSQFYTTPGFQYPGVDVFPNIQFEDLGLQIGPDPNAPQFTIQNTYELVDNLNWTKGRHTLRFGFDGRDYIAPQFFIQRVRGDYNYTSLGGFLTDQVPDSLAERNLGTTPYYGNSIATYVYASDQWRIRNNVSLNLGVRWERTTVPVTMKLQNLNEVASVPGLIDFRAPRTQNKNFAPRIGLAWSPGTSGNTSIRAGFGMGYDVIYDNVGLTDYPPQLSPTVDANTRPDFYVAPFLANGGIRPTDLVTGTALSATEARANTGSFIPDQVVPYSIQWNFGVQHVFKNDYTAEVRYLGTRGVHLLQQIQMNKTNTPVTASRTLPTYLTAPSQAELDSLNLTLAQLRALNPFTPSFYNAGFKSNITAFLPIGNSTYNGLAAQLTKRFSHGLQFVGSYTFSHNIDDNTVSHFSTYLTPRRPQDFGDMRNERGNSALDRRHRFTLSWVYQMPLFANSQHWMAKNLIGNWQLTGTYTRETGEFVTAQSGQDSNLNGDSAGDRTVINAAGDPNQGSGVRALTNSAGQTVGYLALNPNARYIQAGLGVFPNGGRNTVEVPGINNFDLSLSKRFNVSEHKAIEIRGDASNIFNHPQYTPGLINSVKLTSYNITRTFLTPQNALFQQWNQVFASNARQMQLAFRFTF